MCRVVIHVNLCPLIRGQFRPRTRHCHDSADKMLQCMDLGEIAWLFSGHVWLRDEYLTPSLSCLSILHHLLLILYNAQLVK